MKYECKRSGNTTYNGKRIRFEVGENDVPEGALDHVGGCKMIPKSDAKQAVVTDSEKREYPFHKGGGYYELSNGEQVRGKEDAIEAQKEIDNE